MFCNKYKNKLHDIEYILMDSNLTNMQKNILIKLYLYNRPETILDIYPTYLGISKTAFKRFIQDTSDKYLDVLVDFGSKYKRVFDKKEPEIKIKLKGLI